MPTLIEDGLIDTVQLSFEQTVPRSLVHKRSLENVLLTEVKSHSEDRFLCAGRLPTAHRFFNDSGRTPRQDILFYTELGRQASLAISHAFLGVSRGEVFIFEGSHAAVNESAWKSAAPAGFDSIITEIKILETQRRRNNAVNRVVAEQTMSIAGETVFHGTGAWTMQPAALFQRLRRMSAGRAASDVRPNEISEKLPNLRGENAVISEPQFDEQQAAFVSTLVIDETHPYFFDHPCDHVPGMLLLEGCAQLSLTAAARVTTLPQRKLAVSAYEVNFVQFVECNVPVTVTAQVETAANSFAGLLPLAVHISISQHGVVSGTATMSIAFPV